MAEWVEERRSKFGRDAIVSTVRVEHGPAHDRVSIWNRGGLAGVLVVSAGDGRRLSEFLIPQAAPEGGKEEGRDG